MEKDSEEIIKVTQKIKRYLNKHPHAADTSEGVVQWLAQQQYEDSLKLVNDALEVLVEEQVVSKISLKDGTVIYRRFE